MDFLWNFRPSGPGIADVFEADPGGFEPAEHQRMVPLPWRLCGALHKRHRHGTFFGRPRGALLWKLKMRKTSYWVAYQIRSYKYSLVTVLVALY